MLIACLAFDLDTFAHVAFYNPGYGRIEMHLQSTKAQDVYIGQLARSFHFWSGETIHTENSYKYTYGQIEEICSEAKLSLRHHWLDHNNLFSLNLLGPA